MNEQIETMMRTIARLAVERENAITALINANQKVDELEAKLRREDPDESGRQ